MDCLEFNWNSVYWYFLFVNSKTITGDKMDDYAKARYKSNRRLTILKMTTKDGGMNPEMSSVDFIQDGDLNKSLKHYVSTFFRI